MAYTVPTFNLKYGLYRIGGWDPTTFTWDFSEVLEYSQNHPGQLYDSKRTGLYRGFIYAELSGGGSQVLLVPKGTDIRDAYCGLDSIDCVEVPQLSGRIYAVTGVDDTARGFINEYRVCSLVKLGESSPFMVNAFPWPSPIP